MRGPDGKCGPLFLVWLVPGRSGSKGSSSKGEQDRGYSTVQCAQHVDMRDVPSTGKRR